jgi:hyaluronan synthase
MRPDYEGRLKKSSSTLPFPEIEYAEREETTGNLGQRISKEGQIQVSKKAWAVRALVVAGIIFFIIYNTTIALVIGDPIIIYSTLIPIHSVMVFVVGWLFFRHKTTDVVPTDLVSVIIPVYNQESLIEKVIHAVLKSTYPNIEVVAVNDGSKDKTGLVLDALAKENQNLKVLHKTNGGKRTAVATGFYASRGDYIVLIDSDSVVDRHAIEELMKVLSANPEVGGVVGDGKVLNANKNVLTKCQDAWYDYAFNIHKTTESTFGAVLCCSGCLAAYRRKAIARFIPFWAEAKVQNSDDRDLTTYAIATDWAKSELAPISRQLMKSMASYDDSEDRGLTVHTLTSWKTVYVPTAIVYTEVPEKLRSYIRQQIRWKKGYLRSCFFASAFFWRKNPIMSLIFYTEFMTTFIAPAIIFSVYIYSPFILQNYWLPISYFAGQLLIGLAAGLDYKFRKPASKNWVYKPLMNVIASLILPWLIFPALWTFKKNLWLTR